jgi:hypothetical protein
MIVFLSLARATHEWRVVAMAALESSACENETIILFSAENGICNLTRIAALTGSRFPGCRADRIFVLTG